MAWIGGAIAAGGSLLSGVIGADAAGSAAKTQAQASQAAINAQLGEQRTIQGQLAPFLGAGTNALQQLPGAIGGDNFDARITQLAQMGWGVPQLNLPTQLNIPDPSNPATINQFHQSPGYQYALKQSGDVIQNSAAGKTGALSGNMLQALQGNAIGLADQDYYNWLGQANQYGQGQFNAQTQGTLGNFNAQNSNFWNLYNALNQGQQQGVNNLQNLAGMGQNAAVNAGQQGVALAGNVGQQLVGQGQAVAAGQLGAAGQISGGINNALTALTAPNSSGQSSLSALIAALTGGGGGGGGVGGAQGYPNQSPIY